MLFAYEAGLTELVRVLDVRQAAHRTATRHPLDAVEVQAPEPSVPVPGFGHVTNSETDMMNRSERQFVQAIWGGFTWSTMR